MSEKHINSRIIHKHDIESNWLKAINFIPKQGELIVYDIEEETDVLPEGRTNRYTYERFKIGDGISNVNDLPFADENKADKEHTHNISDIYSYSENMFPNGGEVFNSSGPLSLYDTQVGTLIRTTTNDVYFTYKFPIENGQEYKFSTPIKDSEYLAVAIGDINNICLSYFTDPITTIKINNKNAAYIYISWDYPPNGYDEQNYGEHYFIKATSLRVDTELSETSNNPVANSVITNALDNKVDYSYLRDEINNSLATKVDLATKADKEHTHNISDIYSYSENMFPNNGEKIFDCGMAAEEDRNLPSPEYLVPGDVIYYHAYRDSSYTYRFPIQNGKTYTFSTFTTHGGMEGTGLAIADINGICLEAFNDDSITQVTVNNENAAYIYICWERFYDREEMLGDEYFAEFTSTKEEIATKASINSERKSVSGSTIIIDDIYPIEHNVNVQLENTDVKLKVSGKNLFDSQIVANLSCASVEDDGTIKLFNPTSADINNQIKFYINHSNSNGPLILSYKYKTETSNTSGMRFCAHYKETSKDSLIGAAGTVEYTDVVFNSIIDSTYDNYTLEYIYAEYGTTNTTWFKDIQLEFNEKTEYEPYVGKEYEGSFNNIKSISPKMILRTDENNIYIKADYISKMGVLDLLDNKLDTTGTAIKAIADSDGNVFSETYMTKDEMSNKAPIISERNTANGATVVLKDIADLEHIVNVQLTAPEGTELPNLKVSGRNIFNPELLISEGAVLQEDGSLYFETCSKRNAVVFQNNGTVG